MKDFKKTAKAIFVEMIKKGKSDEEIVETLTKKLSKCKLITVKTYFSDSLNKKYTPRKGFITAAGPDGIRKWYPYGTRGSTS